MCCVGVVICGSGIGGLSCVWWLVKSGWCDVVVVEGLECYGNVVGGVFGMQCFLMGVYYLLLLLMELMYVCEMLVDFGVIECDLFLLCLMYDECVFVYVFDECLWFGNCW